MTQHSWYKQALWSVQQTVHKSGNLSPACSDTKLLHEIRLSFSLTLGIIMPIHFCQALVAKNEESYIKKRCYHFITRKASP